MVPGDGYSELVDAARDDLSSGGNLDKVAEFLHAAGMSEIDLIRALRELTGMDLVEAKRVAYESSVGGQRTLEEHQRGLAETLKRASTVWDDVDEASSDNADSSPL